MTRESYRNIILALATLVSGTFFFPLRAAGQPVLNFKQIGLNWPSVELTFNVRCQNILQFNFDKRNFTIRENGFDVDNYSLNCGDTTRRASTSIALVIDKSGSMGQSSSAPFNMMRKAANLFIRALEPTRDEAAVLSYNTSVTIDQPLTSDTAALIRAIDSLQVGGSTAIWDAAISALNELITKARGTYRAIVLLTDGKDNSSAHTPMEVIALATGNNIIIYTVGLGTYDAALDALATSTGGRTFSAAKPEELPALYADISRLIIFGSLDCSLVYTGTCIDGGARTVELTVRDMCGGTDTKSLSFTAPTNTGIRTPIRLRAGTVAQRADSIAVVPIELLDSLSFGLFYPADFTLAYDTSCLDFIGVRAPAGSLLEGVPFTSQKTPSGVNFRSNGRKILTGRGLLAEALFRTRDPDDTTFCDLRFAFCSFDEGCMIPVRIDGGVKTIPCRIAPSIAAIPAAGFCAGDTIELASDSGYAGYTWYRNGVPLAEKGERLRVTQEGDYSVTLTNTAGCTGSSAILHCYPLERRAVCVTGDSMRIFGFDGSISLPLIAVPPLDNSRRYDLRFKLRYDPARFLFAGMTPINGRRWWSSLDASLVPDGVWIHAGGSVPDSLRDLLELHFDLLGEEKKSERVLFPIDSLSVAAPCIGEIRTIDPAVLIDGKCSRVAVIRNPHATITASPNPFNPATELRILLPREQFVTLEIFSLFGAKIARPYRGILPEGESRLSFSAAHLSSGTYIALLRTEMDNRICLLHHVK